MSSRARALNVHCVILPLWLPCASQFVEKQAGWAEHSEARPAFGSGSVELGLYSYVIVVMDSAVFPVGGCAQRHRSRGVPVVAGGVTHAAVAAHRQFCHRRFAGCGITGLAASCA